MMMTVMPLVLLLMLLLVPMLLLQALLLQLFIVAATAVTVVCVVAFVLDVAMLFVLLFASLPAVLMNFRTSCGRSWRSFRL